MSTKSLFASRNFCNHFALNTLMRLVAQPTSKDCTATAPRSCTRCSTMWIDAPVQPPAMVSRRRAMRAAVGRHALCFRVCSTSSQRRCARPS